MFTITIDITFHIISRGQRWVLGGLQSLQTTSIWLLMILQQGGHVHTVAFVFQLLEFNTKCKTLRCVSNLFHFRIDGQQCGVLSCILYRLFFDERALVSVGSRTGLIFVNPSAQSSKPVVTKLSSTVRFQPRSCVFLPWCLK